MVNMRMTVLPVLYFIRGGGSCDKHDARGRQTADDTA